MLRPGSLFANVCVNVFRRWGERPNERVITVGIGWVLLECATNGFSGCNFGQSNPKALFSTLPVCRPVNKASISPLAHTHLIHRW